MTNEVSGATHMVIIPMQLVFDTCKVAEKITGDPPPPGGVTPPPTEPPSTINERMRTVALEAHFLTVCPHQHPTNDPNPAVQEYTDEHEFGCGPYPPVPTPAGVPTPVAAMPFNPCADNVGSARPTPTPTPPPGNIVYEKGTHPPVGKAQVLFDLCIAAYDLSEASMSMQDPNVLASNYDSGGVLWETRFARLATEVHLYLNCSADASPAGRPDYPPNENNPDFSANRNFGCGPYAQTPAPALKRH